MKLSWKKIIPCLLVLAIVIIMLVTYGGPPESEDNSLQLASPTPTEQTDASATKSSVSTPSPSAAQSGVTEDGTYDSKAEVAEYIHTYGHLPSNYITKKEAESLGWSGGSLRDVAPGKCIGGDRFGNYEGRLPAKKGRTYYECDIDTLNWKNRGSRRIIYSNDGLIFYTGDHYETFEQLYGEG